MFDLGRSVGLRLSTGVPELAQDVPNEETSPEKSIAWTISMDARTLVSAQNGDLKCAGQCDFGNCNDHLDN